VAERTRCGWADPQDPLYVAYHDEEWGVPLHDERALFELLVLEGFQAGLSWRTILHKRAAFRRALDGFRPEKLARWGPERVARALEDPGIVRHRGKIEAAVANARAALALRAAGESLDALAWRVVGGRPMVNTWRRGADVPARTAESEALSRELRARGFAFVGPTTAYAFMQAAGLVNDHVVGCFRHRGRPRRSRRS
jgi:DNA-3-methyladenine glycosylase I